MNKKIKSSQPLSLHAPPSPSVLTALLSFFIIFLFFKLLFFWKLDSYCFIRVRFYHENFYFFSVHFSLNELRPNHFPTFEIFVKISSQNSLTAYHPENRKIFCLSQNSTKLFWVIRFRETNLTAHSVSSFEI